MTRRFFALDTMGVDDPALAFLAKPKSGFFRQDYKLVLGERVGANYPQNAHMVMDPEMRGRKLSSLLGNADNFLICHRDMARVICELSKNEIDVHPLIVHDHRGKVASQDHVIVNPIGAVPCLDERESGFERAGKKVVAMERMVINERLVPKGWHLFRPEHADGEIIFTKEMGIALAAGNFTNVTFEELKVISRRPCTARPG